MLISVGGGVYKPLWGLKLNLHLQFLQYYIVVILLDEVQQITSSYQLLTCYLFWYLFVIVKKKINK